MKLNVFTDGGSRGNPGNAAIGVIIYSKKTGNVVFKHSEFIGTATNNEAEYKAFIKALKWIKDNYKEKEEVSFFLDSKLVVEQINKNWKIKNERMKNFAIESWDILKSFSFKITITHVRREKNKEADKLVNDALDLQK